MPDYFAQFLSTEIGLPLLCSLVTGMLIGIDREVQGKPAGLRTHAPVCLAATLLTLAAAQQELRTQLARQWLIWCWADRPFLGKLPCSTAEE